MPQIAILELQVDGTKNYLLLLIFSIFCAGLSHRHILMDVLYFILFQNWLAFKTLHRPLFSEHNDVSFQNRKLPSKNHNFAFCKVRITQNLETLSFEDGTETQLTHSPPHCFTSKDQGRYLKTLYSMLKGIVSPCKHFFWSTFIIKAIVAL